MFEILYSDCGRDAVAWTDYDKTSRLFVGQHIENLLKGGILKFYLGDKLVVCTCFWFCAREVFSVPSTPDILAYANIPEHVFNVVLG